MSQLAARMAAMAPLTLLLASCAGQITLDLTTQTAAALAAMVLILGGTR